MKTTEKTYAELRREELFDWNAFLENPPIDGSESHDYASDLASSWVTCACGTQCEIIPRDHRGVPLDGKLGRLGCAFADHIQNGEWGAAKETLREIEERSAEIIAAILAKRPTA